MGIRDVYIFGWVVPCGGLGTSDRHWYFWPLAEIGDVNMVGRGGVGDRDREHSSFRGVMACGRDFWLIWLIRRGGIMPICTGGIGSPVQHAKRQSTVDSLQKWTMFFHKKNMYSDIPDVLHLALCLQKSKQPAPKKTVYEVQDTWMALQSSVI